MLTNAHQIKFHRNARLNTPNRISEVMLLLDCSIVPFSLVGSVVEKMRIQSSKIASIEESSTVLYGINVRFEKTNYNGVNTANFCPSDLKLK
jgi:hypothetical protein